MNDVEERPGSLFVSDAEIGKRLGVGPKTLYPAIQVLDATRGSGFPPKQKLWGNKRYWPAVKAYFDKAGGLK